MLIAVLLGPWATVLVMTCVIGVQGFLFQDGGLLALGFNVVNMGIISGFVGYAIYVLVRRWLGRTPTAQLIGAGVGAWLSVVVASTACALELAASGTSPLALALPAMVGVHVADRHWRSADHGGGAGVHPPNTPRLDRRTGSGRGKGLGLDRGGLADRLGDHLRVAARDSNPDGLERVAEDQGFIALAQSPTYELMPDYTIPFIQQEGVTTIAAGVIGVLAVATVGYGVARLTGRKPGEQA